MKFYTIITILCTVMVSNTKLMRLEDKQFLLWRRIVYSNRDHVAQKLESDQSDIGLQNLTQIVAGVQYKGQWHSQSQIDQYSYLKNVQGNSFLIFYTNSSSHFFNTENTMISEIEFQMLDPKYPEERQVYSKIRLQNYNSSTISWKGTGFLNYTGFYKFEKTISSLSKCEVDYLVRIKFSDANHPSYENCIVQMNIVSLDQAVCQLNYNVFYEQDTTNYQFVVLLYCLYINLICALQFVCVNKLCKDLLENDEDINRVQKQYNQISIMSVGFVTIYDSYLCFQNLYFAMSNYIYFQYFIIPSFFYFLLSSTSDMKLLWIVWRARYLNDIADNQQMRKAVAIFFGKFYSFLIVFFVVMSYLELNNWFILSISLFMCPQIVHNAIRGNNPKFIPEYIFGVLASKMLYALYFRGCPHNFRGLQPSIIFCASWVSMFLIQIFVLYIQYKFGSRSLIPKFLLPRQYNYFQSFKIRSEDETVDDCAICLGSLLMEPDQMEQNLDAIFLTRTIMITPCGHRFHIRCLGSWLDLKLSCPTCRKNIPAVNPI